MKALTCEQSGHAYTATLDISMPQEGSGGLGLRPSLVVGDALPFSSLPIAKGSGSVSSLCSDAAGTGLDELGLGCQRHLHCGLGLGSLAVGC